MPFGFRTAPQSFQRLIDQVLKGLPFAYGYIDDIISVIKNIDDHKGHLYQVFSETISVWITNKIVVLAPLNLNFIDPS